MIEPTFLTWIIAVLSIIVFLPLIGVQLLVILKPDDQKTKDLVIGKGEDWRDKTHKKSARAFAWADWLLVLLLLAAGNIGVLLGRSWGYILWIPLGFISIYFSILCWVLEKEYTYPAYGPLAYYTYYWGSFLYWGIAAIIYSGFRLLS